ncbi:hypothetical protein BH11PLA2_BH11PLA2_04250 [soil metagenome]
MSRHWLLGLALIGTISMLSSARPIEQATPANPAATLDGTWELVAMIEDGTFMPLDQAKKNLLKDGRMTIQGSLAMMTQPDGSEKTLAFITNAAVSPKQIDLAGVNKFGTKGIYMLDGESLVICLKESDHEGRPAAFTAQPGSDTVLLSFRRVQGGVIHKPLLAPPAPVAAKPIPVANELKASLVGRWGYQNDTVVQYLTVNADGTFSVKLTYKKGFKKLFKIEERSSGTWDLNGHTVVYKYTASTDNGKIGQIYSVQIVDILPGEMIYIDNQTGNRRIEWKLN